MSSSPSPTTLGIDHPLCSSSVETIRGLPAELTLILTDMPSPDTDSPPRTPPAAASDSSYSRPPSPHSSWPSPSSPSGDSVSSFPSVSSSFLFSSNPETPPHVDLELADHHHRTAFAEDEDPHGLIIPSLILPSPLKRPTQYGKALGDVRLLVLSNSHRSADEVLRILADEDCEDYVDVGHWEDGDFESVPGEPLLERPKVLRISTDWLEHRDAHGLERYEATRNIELVHLPEYAVHHHVCPVLLSEVVCSSAHVFDHVAFADDSRSAWCTPYPVSCAPFTIEDRLSP